MSREKRKTVEKSKSEREKPKETAVELERGRTGIDRVTPCETRGRPKNPRTGPPRVDSLSRGATGTTQHGHGARRFPRYARARNSLVTQEYLLGQLAVKHLVRVPQAPGHGVLGERLFVQQRHDDGGQKCVAITMVWRYDSDRP